MTIEKDGDLAKSIVNDALDIDLDSLSEDKGESHQDDDGFEDDEPESSRDNRDDDEGGPDSEGEDDELDDLSIDGPERRAPSLADPEHKYDKRGNVVDASGKVIAPAGAARRFYERAAQAGTLLQRAHAQYQDINGRFDKLYKLAEDVLHENERLRNNAGAKLGLTETEQVDAIQLMAEAKRDPASAVKKILTRAAAGGMDLSTITGQPGGGFDAKAFMDMVREEIAKVTKPVAERTEADRQSAEAESQRRESMQTAANTLREHFGRRKDHVKYAPIYERVLRANRGMTLGEIEARIDLNLLRNAQRQTRRQRSIPRGRSGMNGQGDGKLMDPNTSWDDVIRAAMKDANM